MTEETQRISRIVRENLQIEALFGVKDIPLPRSSFANASSGAAQGSAESGAAVRDAGEAEAQLRVLDEQSVRGCTKCGLSATRTNTVFGQGSPTARLAFVGEAPGYHEDQKGLAFVGRAGELLTRMIVAMGLAREDVFICNVLKCRPPENRDPAPDEIAACSPHLMKQLSIIQPEVIVALGAPAARTLLETKEGIGRLRGRFHDFNIDGPLSDTLPVPLMPTYHPAYLLRNAAEKTKAWADLQQVMQLLGLQRPR